MSQILHILRKAKHPTAERTARLCNAPAPQASTQTVGGSVLDQQLSPGNDFSQMPLYSDEHSTKQLQTTSLSQTPGQQLIARELARATRQGVDSHFSGQNQLQSKLLSPAVSHFSLPVQRQVDEKGEEEEAKRVAELKANYDAAVKAKDWNRAAVLLVIG